VTAESAAISTDHLHPPAPTDCSPWLPVTTTVRCASDTTPNTWQTASSLTPRLSGGRRWCAIGVHQSNRSTIPCTSASAGRPRTRRPCWFLLSLYRVLHSGRFRRPTYVILFIITNISTAGTTRARRRTSQSSMRLLRRRRKLSASGVHMYVLDC